MAERIHLGTVEQPDGTIWYTLIVESPTRFHVETYNDSNHSFLKERLSVVPVSEFDKHFIDGMSLATLVADKFKQKNFQGETRPPLFPRKTL